MAKYDNAPLCTIDLSALKSSRFLWSQPDQAPQLPYRDAEGLINLHLCKRSKDEVDSGRVVPPAEVLKKLESWVKHAKAWNREANVQWERRPSCDGGFEWVSSKGVVRPEVSSKGDVPMARQTTDPTAAPKQLLY